MSWRLRLTWRSLCKRLYQEYGNHAVGDGAATLAYYFVFSLFPFLFVLATLTAYIPHIRASTDTLPLGTGMPLESFAVQVDVVYVRK